MPTTAEWQNPEMDRRLIVPGEAWHMSALDIHAISHGSPAPVSIVVQGPRQRTESYVYDETTGKVAATYPDNHGPVEYFYSNGRERESYLAV